jgi:hypothetical protein
MSQRPRVCRPPKSAGSRGAWDRNSGSRRSADFSPRSDSNCRSARIRQVSRSAISLTLDSSRRSSGACTSRSCGVPKYHCRVWATVELGTRSCAGEGGASASSARHVRAMFSPSNVGSLLKERDGGADHLILLLKDSRHNRSLLREWSGSGTRFPVSTASALEALAQGKEPPGNAIVRL